MRTNGELQRRRRPRPEIKCCQWPGGGGTSAVPGRAGGSELLWCGALGGRRPGGPGAAAGLGGAAERLQGWGGPDVLRGPGTAGSRPGPARGGRATPRELPGGEFAPQPKEGGSRRGPEKPSGHPGPEPPGSCPSLGRPPGRPRRRVTVLGSRPEEPPGDPRRGPASSGANPGAWSRGGRGFPEARGRGPKEPGRGGAGPGLPGARRGSACSGDRLRDPRARGPQ